MGVGLLRIIMRTSVSFKIQRNPDIICELFGADLDYFQLLLNST